MKVNRTLALVLILTLTCGPYLGGLQVKSPDEKQETEAQKSLVRKDLLKIKKDVPSRPRRNIFSPRGMEVSDEDVASLLSPRDFQEQETVDEEETPFYEVSLRYIGYIDTGERIVALIIFEGEAVAVEENEMISEQFKVGKVTRETLAIIGPGGEKREFPLEGE